MYREIDGWMDGVLDVWKNLTAMMKRGSAPVPREEKEPKILGAVKVVDSPPLSASADPDRGVEAEVGGASLFGHAHECPGAKLKVMD